jgi:hypothetical protein
MAKFCCILPPALVRRRSGILALLAACGMALVTSVPATAQWRAYVSGPDEMGNTTVNADAVGASGNALVIHCNQNDTLYLAYLIAGTKSELTEMARSSANMLATLLIEIGNGAPIKFEAEFRLWNSEYLAVVASGRAPGLVAAVQAIGTAKGRIGVGAEVYGLKERSDSIGSAGSAGAMNTVMKECKLDEVAPPASGAARP